MLIKFRTIFLAILFFVNSYVAFAEIIIQPTPDQGLQPRLSVDDNGNVHLLYFKKRINRPASREGNLYYRSYDHETGQFSLPVKVSSSAFSMQTFSIARASMAITEDGRVHAFWYYPRTSEMIYSRSNPERTMFETQRSMVSVFQEGIDAGGDIASIGSSVALVWGAGKLTEEHQRTMFARFSDDYGKTFSDEVMVSNPDLGACACCSLAADYAGSSDLVIGYRSAIDGVGRHMQVLTLKNINQGITGAFYGEMSELQEWEASFCPLSTNDIERTGEQRWLVFETQNRIMRMELMSQNPVSAVGEPFSETRQKNPALAINHIGEQLIVWGEAISHSRGGRLNLRLLNKDGSNAEYSFTENIMINDYSFPAAASLPNNDFMVLH
ncbi:MAG: hypothetical protein ACPGKO_00050 [Pseudohongiellaceae bacterium]